MTTQIVVALAITGVFFFLGFVLILLSILSLWFADGDR